MLDELTPAQLDRYHQLQRDNPHIPIDELIEMILCRTEDDAILDEYDV